MSNKRKYRKHLKDSVEAMGFKDVIVEQNSHMKVYARWGSQKYGPWVFPQSPSNNIGWTQKGVQNQIRKILRRSGVIVADNNNKKTTVAKTKQSVTDKNCTVVSASISEPTMTKAQSIELGRKRLAQYRMWQQKQQMIG